MYVNARGAAFAAGLLPGDVITAVDGQPAASIPVYEMRVRLRNEAPGMVVAPEIKCGSATRSVRIEFRDQI